MFSNRLIIRPFFAWYDFWVGIYWDRAKRILYFMPIPMFGIWIKIKRHNFSMKLETCPVKSSREGWTDKEKKQGYPDWFTRFYKEAGLIEKDNDDS